MSDGCSASRAHFVGIDNESLGLDPGSDDFRRQGPASVGSRLSRRIMQTEGAREPISLLNVLPPRRSAQPAQSSAHYGISSR